MIAIYKLVIYSIRNKRLTLIRESLMKKNDAKKLQDGDEVLVSSDGKEFMATIINDIREEDGLIMMDVVRTDTREFIRNLSHKDIK
jgi:phosphopantetheine adenylyltransferase